MGELTAAIAKGRGTLIASLDILSEYKVPINGIPTRLPMVDVVDVAAKRRPDKDLSTFEARNARRLTVTPDPKVIIQKPTTSVERLDETAIEIDPAQRSRALAAEISRSRVNGPTFMTLEMNELASGSSAKKTMDDTTALREKMSPA